MLGSKLCWAGGLCFLLLALLPVDSALGQSPPGSVSDQHGSADQTAEALWALGTGVVVVLLLVFFVSYLSGGLQRGIGSWLKKHGRNYRYFSIWLIGAVGGVAVALAPDLLLRTLVSIAPWLKTGTWSSYVLDQLAKPQFPGALSSNAVYWVVLWSLLVGSFWLYLMPRKADAAASGGWTDERKTQTRYVLLWVAGLLALIPGAQWLIHALVPQIEGILAPFTSFLSLVTVWTTLLFLWFLASGGDGSDTYKERIAPYRGVWGAFAVVLMMTIISSDQGFTIVDARVRGDFSSANLAYSSVSRLNTAGTGVRDSLANLEGYGMPRVVTDVSTSLGAPDCLGYTNRLENVVQRCPGRGLLDDLQANVSNALQTANDADGQLAAATAMTLPTSVSGALMRAHGMVTGVQPTLQSLEADTSKFVADTNSLAQQVRNKEQTDTTVIISQSIALQNRLRSDLIPRAESVLASTSIANQSLAATRVSGLELMEGTSALYAVFILFPWLLLLLFLYRKRQGLAAQIAVDLLRLDPKKGLLNRVADREADQKQKKDFRSLLNSPKVSYASFLHTEPNYNDQPDQQKLVDYLANQAFSNFEYISSLVFLSILTAVGWYFILYPSFGVGLSRLIEGQGGIKEFVTFVVGSLSPLTLGFAGAYFYSLTMLVRRYLWDDLYPAAFLQAAQRVLMVLVLSLLLNIIAPYILTATDPSLATLTQASGSATPTPTATSTSTATGPSIPATSTATRASGISATVTPTPQAVTPTDTATPLTTTPLTIFAQGPSGASLVSYAAAPSPPTLPASPTATGTVSGTVSTAGTAGPGNALATATPDGANSGPDSQSWQHFFYILTAAIAFFAGIFPVWGVNIVRGWLRRFLHATVPDMGEASPLTELEGISIWTDARLLEEKVDNVEAMATANIEQLVLNTHYTTAEIVDWIDQAILYLHCGDRGGWFPRLRNTGITSASSFLRALGYSFNGRPAGQGQTPLSYQLAGPATPQTPVATLCAAINKSAPPAQGADADAHPSVPPTMTEEILGEMACSIQLASNLQYIMNFYGPMLDAQHDGRSGMTYLGGVARATTTHDTSPLGDPPPPAPTTNEAAEAIEPTGSAGTGAAPPALPAVAETPSVGGSPAK